METVYTSNFKLIAMIVFAAVANLAIVALCCYSVVYSGATILISLLTTFCWLGGMALQEIRIYLLLHKQNNEGLSHVK